MKDLLIAVLTVVLIVIGVAIVSLVIVINAQPYSGLSARYDVWVGQFDCSCKLPSKYRLVSNGSEYAVIDTRMNMYVDERVQGYISVSHSAETTTADSCVIKAITMMSYNEWKSEYDKTKTFK